MCRLVRSRYRSAPSHRRYCQRKEGHTSGTQKKRNRKGSERELSCRVSSSVNIYISYYLRSRGRWEAKGKRKEKSTQGPCGRSGVTWRVTPECTLELARTWYILVESY